MINLFFFIKYDYIYNRPNDEQKKKPITALFFLWQQSIVNIIICTSI
jgi:hypothetical protein